MESPNWGLPMSKKNLLNLGSTVHRVRGINDFRQCSKALPTVTFFPSLLLQKAQKPTILSRSTQALSLRQTGESLEHFYLVNLKRL